MVNTVYATETTQINQPFLNENCTFDEDVEISFMVNGSVSVDETLMTRMTCVESVVAVVLVTSLSDTSIPLYNIIISYFIKFPN